MSTDDRRAQGATRIPFEALVEVGGSLGPSFEAQAVNVSEDGMHLRTAYLPEIGQPLSCRFDAGPDGTVLASGEVVWTQEAGKGGEFGIRFTNLDAESAQALERMMGVGDTAPTRSVPGARVRLHIEGLGSPMRARVKNDSGGDVTAYSELGFLQVGKHLELEDAQTGNKRPAHIDRVEVETDATSHVPQLVVRLRYDDAQARVDAARAHSKEATPEPTVIHEELEENDDVAPHAVSAHRSQSDLHAFEQAGDAMKGAFARGASKVTPAIMKMMKRARVTVALLAAKRQGSTGEDVSIPVRRRTSPPIGGGLHASGRKVVRGDSLPDARAQAVAASPLNSLHTISRKKLAIGGAVGLALILGAVAMRKPAATAADGTSAATATSAGTPTTAESPVAPPASVLSPVQGLDPNAAPAATPPSTLPLANAAGQTMAPEYDETTDETTGGSRARSHRNASRVAAFSNGPVAHGNVLRLKMDGPIEKIEGAAQPTGFTVVLPARRSLEAAAPLAARDSRIASIRVSNDTAGAELSVAFKDGVPNYTVRAKGDVLEIVLASLGAPAAASDARPTHVTKRSTDAAPTRHHKGHARH